MSKVFEEEYRKLAECEIPDLWDRIEAGLSEKKPALMAEQEKIADEMPAYVESTPIMINEVPNSDTSNKDTDNKAKKKAALIFFRKYQTVAAALLCVMILVPAFLLMRQIDDGMNKSSSEAATDTAPAEMTETVVEEAAAEEPAAKEAAMEEMTTEETSEEMTAAAVTEAAAEEAMESETAAGIVENAEMEAAKDLAMNDETKQSAENKRAEAALYQVSIKVIQKQEIDSVTETENTSGSIYQCVVVGKTDAGQLEINDEITVYVPTLLAEELIQGEVYELDLTESTSEYYDYTAKSLYN